MSNFKSMKKKDCRDKNMVHDFQIVGNHLECKNCPKKKPMSAKYQPVVEEVEPVKGEALSPEQVKELSETGKVSKPVEAVEETAVEEPVVE